VAFAASACGDDDDGTIDANTNGAADAADGVDAADAAAAFCADPYADLADCETRFNGYGASRQSCVITHVGFAAGGMASLHCTHAEGLDPCD
jgi:hypothetical protein